MGVTSEDADASGAGGHNGAVKIERGRVAVRRGNPERNSSGVRERKGGPEASGVAETPGGLLRSGRGGQVAEGHQKPQSGRVAPGGGNPQIDPQGQQSARGIRTGSGRGKKLPSHPRHRREQQHQLQSPQRGKAWGKRGEINTHRHPDSADSARPKHGALARREYGLLAPEDPEGDQAAAETQGSGYSPQGYHKNKKHRQEGDGGKVTNHS